MGTGAGGNGFFSRSALSLIVPLVLAPGLLALFHYPSCRCYFQAAPGGSSRKRKGKAPAKRRLNVDKVGAQNKREGESFFGSRVGCPLICTPPVPLYQALNRPRSADPRAWAADLSRWVQPPGGGNIDHIVAAANRKIASRTGDAFAVDFDAPADDDAPAPEAASEPAPSRRRTSSVENKVVCRAAPPADDGIDVGVSKQGHTKRPP